jgi:hypothetical protein
VMFFAFVFFISRSILISGNARVRRAPFARRTRPAGCNHCVGFRSALPDLKASLPKPECTSLRSSG